MSWILLVLVICGDPVPLEITDPVPVAVITDHFEIHMDRVTRVWKTHDMVPMSLKEWTARFGPLRLQDIKEFQLFGCLRYHVVLHHYEL